MSDNPEAGKASTQPPLADNWVTEEIRAMLHGFGDSRSPLPATVNLVENVVMEQMRSAIFQASDVCFRQERDLLKAQDFLFLMRKDQVKLRRILKYLYVKAQLKLDATDGSGDSEHIQKKATNANEEECLDLIRSNREIFKLETEKPDMMKDEQRVQACQRSSSLDNGNYAEYYRCREASFSSPSHKTDSFYEIVMKTIKDQSDIPKFSSTAKDVLCYFAYETVAQIVELCFLVRQDAASHPSDPFARYVGISFPHPPYEPVTSSQEIGTGPPLTPNEVHEALRRYFAPQFNPFKATAHLRNRLLAC